MRLIVRLAAMLSLTAVAGLVGVAQADALTLGNTTLPSGATPNTCTTGGATAEALQTGTDSAYDYTVPTGGGQITSWSFNTTGATAGTPYGLVVARPAGGGYTIVGSDLETVPASPGGIVTFTLSTPITVQAGDILGVLLTGASSAECYYENGSLTASDVLGVAEGGSTSNGTPLSIAASQADTVTDVSATLVQSEDAGVVQQVLPGSITSGGVAAFVLSVSDAGPGSAPVTVTDSVPSGLTIQSVSAGSATCSITGQVVSCSVPSAPSTIAIIVSAATPGSYANVASVQAALTDPNPANNISSEALTVTAPPTVAPPTVALCHVVSLAGTPLSTAKTVITALGCKVGKVTKKTSKHVPKGDVISNTPHAGIVALGTSISIIESSGKPKPKKKKR